MRFLLLSLVVFLSATEIRANPNDREWPGMEARHCGTELSVTTVDGEETVFHPPETFFARFESEEIDQGEFPRKATELGDMLSRYEADQLMIVDCSDRRHEIDRDRLGKEDLLVVLTGKGLLKIVSREASGYRNRIKPVQALAFSADTPPAEDAD